MKHFEPVVKKSASYSILFLRDDSGVVRFRLKPFWIKFLAVVFVIFSGTSGAAGYAAHYYWKRYNTIKQEYSGMEARLGESSRKLAAYSSVEMIKESQPRSSMTGVASLAPNGGQEAGPAPAQNGNNGTTVNSPAASPPTPTPQAGGNGNGTATPPSQPADGPDSPAPGGQPPQTAAVTPGATAPPEQAGQTAAGSDPASKEHPALISEVVVRSDGGKKFTLAFDLSNRDKDLTLNGRVLVYVATKDGTRHEISQVNRNALRFIINNYKRVNTNFTLPTEVAAEEVSRLFLTVTNVKVENQPEIPDVTYAFPVPSPS